MGYIFFGTPFCYGKSLANLNPLVVSNYPQSRAILNDYALFMKQLNGEKSLHVKLEKINNYINRIVPKYDEIGINTDYWATRLEFLVSGGGDCEDYAIAKYQSLLDLGFDAHKMGLCVAKDRYSGTMHMVLGVKEGGLVQILDNLSFRILPHDKRKDLEFYGCLSKNKKFGFGQMDSWNSSPPKALLEKFHELLGRIEIEKMWKD
jgi:predicted transglutaminase-like cysteine proteinase